MDLKLFIICTLVILVDDVKSDCDDYLKCLGDIINNFFGYKENNSTLTDIRNNTKVPMDKLEYDNVQNTSISIFEITDLQKSLNRILSDVTTLIKDEIEGKLKIKSESDSFKTVNNETEILIKTFDFDEVLGELDNKDDTTNNETKKITGPIDEIAASIEHSDEYFKDLVVSSRELVANNNTGVKMVLIPDNNKIYNDAGQLYKNDNNTSLFHFDLNSNTESILDNKGGHVDLKSNPNAELMDKKTKLQVYNIEEIVQFPMVLPLPKLIGDNIADERTKTIESIDNLKTNIDNKTALRVQPFYPNYIPLSILQYEEESAVSNSTEELSVNKTVVLSKRDEIKEKSKIETTTDKKQENVTIFKTKIPENISNDAEIIQDIIVSNPTVINNTKTVVSSEVTHTYDIKIFNSGKIEDTKLEEKISDTDDDNEVDITDFEDYYNDIQNDNTTDYPIIDYIELYKDTTNEDVEYDATEIPTVVDINNVKVSDLDNAIEYSVISDERLRNDPDNGTYSESNETNAAVFPWIASIYIKNGTSNQFDYFCDGALLSQNVILTAARCIYTSNATLDAENLIIIAGKRSLQTTEDGERVHRVKEITVHTNFKSTGDDAENDLAILVLEELVTYSSAIQAASLYSGEVGEYGESFTTGWAFSGNLTPIYFDKEKTKYCKKTTNSVNIFCASYGNDVTTCPSYGGLYVTKLNNQWTLQGLRTGDPTDRSFCIDKTVMYTSLINFVGWIIDNIALNKYY